MVEALEELVEVIIQHDDEALELELAVLKLSVQNRDIVSSFGASEFVKRFGPNLLALQLNPTTDRTKVKILLKLDVPLEFCLQAEEKGGCPQKGCLRLHLCPFFIKNKCKFGVKCKRSHNFSDGQTFRVLNHLRLGFLLNDPSKHSLTKLLNQIVDESEIQRTAASRSVPDICKFYNKGVCTKGANCPCLHICEHFVDDDCKFGKNCKREHSLSDEHNTRVLQEYSIQCTPIVLLFLKGRERKRTVSEGSDVERPIRAKPISAMSDIKPALSQGLAIDSKEKDCEICGFNLRGKCHYGDRCLHRHTELPYLWEFSVNDDDKWESFSSDLNTMLEDAYCDVDSDGYKLRVRGLSCYVQFKDMTVVPKGSTKILQGKMLL